MSNAQENPLLDYVVRLGDDAVIIGHRLSEWCRNGPFLEEDLAVSNVALDFIGRARMFYSYAAELKGDGAKEDDFPYLRDCREFRNFLILELPRGDYAFSMARQFLVDAFNVEFLSQLTRSTDQRLAAIAAKAIKESVYHLRRSTDWVLRLGDGTEESHQRMVKALDDLWGFTHELFVMDELEQNLADAGIAVDRSKLKDAWKANVTQVLTEATLSVPEDSWNVSGGREGMHTEHLGHLLADMQFMQRAYPGLEW